MSYLRILAGLLAMFSFFGAAEARDPPHDMYNGIPCSTRFETASLPNGNLIYCHLAWEMSLMTAPSGGVSHQVTCRANSYTHFDGNNRVVYCVTKSGQTYGAIPQKPKPKTATITVGPKPVQITNQPKVIKFQ